MLECMCWESLGFHWHKQLSEPHTVTLEENKTDDTNTPHASAGSGDPWQENAANTAPSDEKKRNGHFWNGLHWGMKFVVIGWVLNAVVSVKLYDYLVKKYPGAVGGFTQKSQAFFDRLGKAAGSENWADATKKKFSTLGKDFTDVVGTGIGGFLIVPLIAAYNHFEDKLQNVFASKEEKEKFAEHQAEHPKEKESVSHWTVARVLGFSSAVGLYMAIKYMAGEKFAKVNEKAVEWARKATWIPKFLRPSEKEVEYYLAEQIAAVTSTVVLAASKDKLDRAFPVHSETSTPTKHSARIGQKKNTESHAQTIEEQRKQQELQTEMEYAR